MAKSKQQKQQEAQWRKIRGELVDAFRNGSDEKVSWDYGPWFVDKREQLWRDYQELPKAWRETAMDGWNLPDNLRGRLEQAAAEDVAGDIDAATLVVSAPSRRMRF